jgi:hypothetical protein
MVNIYKNDYTKETLSIYSDEGFFFTENLQIYLHIRNRLNEIKDIPKCNNLKINVTCNNNQAGIRTDRFGNINKNAFAIISKKYQQNRKGYFVYSSGQFIDSGYDFDIFTKYNEESINSAINSTFNVLNICRNIAANKSGLPLRFATWLNEYLYYKLKVKGTIYKNPPQRNVYTSYGIYDIN